MNVNEGTSVTYDKDGKEIARGRQTKPDGLPEKKKLEKPKKPEAEK